MKIQTSHTDANGELWFMLKHDYGAEARFAITETLAELCGRVHVVFVNEFGTAETLHGQPSGETAALLQLREPAPLVEHERRDGTTYLAVSAVNEPHVREALRREAAEALAGLRR
jgi:hypothetical protein